MHDEPLDLLATAAGPPDDSTCWAALVCLGDWYLAVEWPRGTPRPTAEGHAALLPCARLLAEEILREDPPDIEYLAAFFVGEVFDEGAWFSIQHTGAVAWLPSGDPQRMQ